MRFVFFGTGSFAIPALECLADSVTLVVTQPERPTGRGLKMHRSEVHQRALDLGLSVATPEKARDLAFVEQVAALEADALVVASYGQILSEKLLNSAKRGGINLHGSILPDGRGAAPIQRSIMMGDTESGVTLMQMDRGMDTGDIIEIRRTPIGADETYGELQDRLAILAAEMAEEWMPRIVAGDYTRIPQPTDGVTISGKVLPEETALVVGNSALVEYNRFRGLFPSYRPHLVTERGRLRLLEVRIGPETEAVPGTVISANPLTVAFAGGSLIFNRVQPEGKNSMSGTDYANGARLRPGICLSV